MSLTATVALALQALIPFAKSSSNKRMGSNAADAVAEVEALGMIALRVQRDVAIQTIERLERELAHEREVAAIWRDELLRANRRLDHAMAQLAAPMHYAPAAAPLQGLAQQYAAQNMQAMAMNQQMAAYNAQQAFAMQPMPELIDCSPGRHRFLFDNLPSR